MEGTAKKTILVVDDMVSILEHVKLLLKDEYKVVPCTEGRQAIEIAKKLKPDLILLDVNLPDFGGFDVLKAVKSSDELMNIPVIMASGSLSAEVESEGFELGASDFIMKPFTPVSLFKRIKMHI